MQDILVEKPYEFVPPHRGDWIPTILRETGVFRRYLRKKEGVIDCEIRNADRLRDSINAGHGVLIAPNHSRTADPMLMGYVCAEIPCLIYSMASWHLFNESAFHALGIRWMGGFSINREGIDRQSIDMAVSILDSGERPLVIFPEGATSRTNDRLMPMLDGVSFIARTAAKRRAKENRGKVVVHPVAIKYVFEGDIHAACKPVLRSIEHRLAWRPQTDKPLIERIKRIGEGLLTLKEIEYFGEVQSGPLIDRQHNLIERLLSPLEDEWLGRSSQRDAGIIARIKTLRMKILPGLTDGKISRRERGKRWRQLEETYLAQQVYCYPENYLNGSTTENRVLETVERFEEDIYDKARIHGNLRAVIDIDEAIEVPTKRERGLEKDPLMEQIRSRLQKKLEEMTSLSRPFREEVEP